MQRIAILCLKQEAHGDDPSDLTTHRGSVSWFYQRENTEITQLQHVSELRWEKPEVLQHLSVLASRAWASAPAEQKPGSGESGNRAFLTDRGSAGRESEGWWWVCHFQELWDQEWMGFWEGKRYFSAEVPVPLLSIHVKKNRSATKGH